MKSGSCALQKTMQVSLVAAQVAVVLNPARVQVPDGENDHLQPKSQLSSSLKH